MGNRRLMLIGGAEDRQGECRVLRTFLSLAGGGRVAIFACAAQAQDETGEAYRELFLRLGAESATVVRLTERSDAERPELRSAVRRASGYFFTGGDQLRLTALLGGTSLLDDVREGVANGVVAAGTSAGASAMSATMIVGGQGEATARRAILRMCPGLGFLPAVVDQHFAQRGRIGRLIAALAENPEMLGVGLDEDTALVVEGAVGWVVGSGAVTVLDARRLGHTNADEAGLHAPVAVTGLTVHVLPEGYGFRLDDRCPLLPGTRKTEAQGAGPTMATPEEGDGRCASWTSATFPARTSTP